MEGFFLSRTGDHVSCSQGAGPAAPRRAAPPGPGRARPDPARSDRSVPVPENPHLECHAELAGPELLHDLSFSSWMQRSVKTRCAWDPSECSKDFTPLVDAFAGPTRPSRRRGPSAPFYRVALTRHSGSAVQVRVAHTVRSWHKSCRSIACGRGWTALVASLRNTVSQGVSLQ